MLKNQVYKFKNGATLVYSNQNIDNSTYVTMGFSCGSFCDPKGKEGLSHLLEHMLFHGAKNLKPKEFHEKIKMTDSNTNAFTSYYCVCMDFDCLSSNFEEIFNMHSKLLLNDQFDKDELEQEKKVVLQEKSVTRDHMIIDNNIDWLMDTDSLSALIKPEGEKKNFDILGNEKTLSGITPEDLKNYSNKYFNSDNLIIAVSSSLPFEDVKEICEQYLVNKVKPNKKNKVQYTEPRYSYIDKDEMIVKDKPQMQSFDIKFVFKNNLENRNQSMMYSLLEKYIFQDFDGLLMQKLRIQNQITYTSFFKEHKLPNFFLKEFDIVTDNKNVHKAINVTTELLRDLVLKGITNEDLTKFKMAILSKMKRESYVKYYDTNHLFFSQLYGKQLFDKKQIYAQALDMTLEQANHYLSDTYGNSNVGVLLSGDTFEAMNVMSYEEFKKRYYKIMSQPVVVTNEHIQKMLDKEVLNVYNSMELLPTLNEMVDKFKPKNLFIKEFAKNLAINNREEIISKENIKVVKNAMIVGAYLAQIQKEQELLLAGAFAQAQQGQGEEEINEDIDEETDEENISDEEAAALEEAKALVEVFKK